MAPSKQETQRQTILHFWRQGITKAAEIYKLTNIPLKTIYRNLKKIKETGDIKHKGNNGRIKKITPAASRALGQYVRRKPSISAGALVSKLEDIGINVSRSTVSRHLADLGYRNSLPLSTPMLTSVHKEKRVEWAQKHKDDDWKKTLFSDETSFQLFRNTIKHWYKGARPVHLMPKD
jgi:transposase